MRVVISGASSGLGLALAQHYLEQGAVVGAIARRAGLLQFLSRQFPNRVFLRTGCARRGCHANAGVSVGTLTEYTEDIDVFQQLMNINVLGIIKTFQPFLVAMRKVKQGILVGITSVAGLSGLPRAGACSRLQGCGDLLSGIFVCEFRGSNVSIAPVTSKPR